MYRTRAVQPLADRLWAKVQKSDGCWEWLGAINENGYGVINLGRRGGGLTRAHRAAWQVVHGYRPERRLDVCHHCDNRKCVRPDHLFLGTRQDNMSDATKKGRVRRGERHTAAKITDHDVVDIRSLAAFGATRGALGRAFGVTASNVTAIVRRQRWAHVQ